MRKSNFRLSALAALSILVSIAANSQTIRRVNNTAGSSAPYTSIQSAVAAAVSGDIILVEGSVTDYPYDVNIDKKLTIQGPGYFLDQNTGIQASPYAAIIARAPGVYGVINFNAGSAGSAIYGMVTANININTTDITIANNYIIGFTNFNAGADNIVYIDNYDGNIQIQTSMNTFLISNSIIAYITMPTSGCFGVITNNILYGGYSHFYNSTFSNNIITAGPFVAIGTVISNNIFTFDPASYPGFTPVDGTNLINVDYNSLFVGASGYTTDTQWKLKTGSPAIGFGTGGVDCGMYGGATSPYKISGVRPGQPTVTSFTSPGTVPQNGTLNIKVSAKVN